MNSAPFFNDAVAGAAVQVKAGRGDITFMRLVNTSGVVAYLQMFGELAANVVLGTTKAYRVIRLGVGESMTVAPGFAMAMDPNGISVAGTTTPTGAVGAAISVELEYC